MSDLISRQAAIDAVYDAFCYAYCDNCEKEMNEDLCGDCHRKYQNWSASKKIIEKVINNLPSVQPEWNNHTVACLLAELFDDTCACNYNGIDEWLPEKCELLDSCPNPVGVACWEQFLKHKAERRTDE